jgi:uridine phosphorylase
MLNHNRGLWGYTGIAEDGEPLTIQSTGLGGASAAAIVADLALLGARRLARVGTCVALDGSAPGTLIEPSRVAGLDGASRALGAGPVEDPEVASTDLPSEPVPAGTRARDLTSGAVLAAARAAGLPCAVVLIVAGLEEDRLFEAEIAAGRRALALLG